MIKYYKRKILKLFLFIFICLPVYSNSIKKYDFRKAQNANDNVCTNLLDKKVVFIGENHDDVVPYSFMTQNIESFYNQGVRYLFLESWNNVMRINQAETYNYRFRFYPIWQTSAWRYEETLFVDEILRINSLYQDDPIKVIFPEKTDEINDDSVTVVLNTRDNEIQQTIFQILQTSKSWEKAIIFYGNAHGSKKEINYQNQKWKPTGVYLKEFYKEQFASYRLEPFSFISDSFCKFNSELECKVIPEDLKKEIMSNTDLNQDFYDDIYVYEKRITGIPYYYVPTIKNLRFIYQAVKDYYFDEDKKDDSLFKLEEHEISLALYALKYHFGNLFEYSCDKDLESAILKLGQTCFYDDEILLSSIKSISKISALEEYCEAISCEEALQDYLLGLNDEINPDFIIWNMKQAKKINSRDIWPQYWISYFKTEKAIKSNSKKDYKDALSEWKKLLDNELIYASPVLNIVYEKLSFCNEKISNSTKSEKYNANYQNLKTNNKFDYKKYKLFGF